MPVYFYAGDPGRLYPDSGIEANPGDVVDTPPADDGRWFPVAEPVADKGAPSATAPATKFDTAQPAAADVAKDVK